VHVPDHEGKEMNKPMTDERLAEIREWVTDGLTAHDAQTRKAMEREMLDEIDRLRALTQWRPIESALKDGREILGYCPAPAREHYTMFAVDVVYWDDADGEWVGVLTDEPPTHWMPLPNPPEVTE
jgi:hypothetical protein